MSVERADSLLGLAIVVIQTLWTGFWEGDDAQDTQMDAWEESSRYGRVTRIQVSEMYKGAPGSVAMVHTGFGGGDCGYDFTRGEDYLVYACYSDDALRPGQRFLGTGICSRTRSRGEDGAEIATLRELSRAAKVSGVR